jgi:hypothetical protein
LRLKSCIRLQPDLLLTTLESIEAMLISVRINRPAGFGRLRAVIVDELHAFAGDDRGWHLRSVLHRLDQYLERPLQRIRLSATVSNPSDLLARRSWRVTQVEWSKRIVWLEPAHESGKARWMGGARSLSREVCQGIRTVLIIDTPRAGGYSLTPENPDRFLLLAKGVTWISGYCSFD